MNSTGAAITTSAESPMNGTGRAIVTAEGATEITVNRLPTLKLASSLKSAFPDAITAAISNQASRVCWIGKTGVL